MHNDFQYLLRTQTERIIFIFDPDSGLPSGIHGPHLHSDMIGKQKIKQQP